MGGYGASTSVKEQNDDNVGIETTSRCEMLVLFHPNPLGVAQK